MTMLSTFAKLRPIQHLSIHTAKYKSTGEWREYKAALRLK
jgi:hypothetical protein